MKVKLLLMNITIEWGRKEVGHIFTEGEHEK